MRAASGISSPCEPVRPAAPVPRLVRARAGQLHARRQLELLGQPAAIAAWWANMSFSSRYPEVANASPTRRRCNGGPPAPSRRRPVVMARTLVGAWSYLVGLQGDVVAEPLRLLVGVGVAAHVDEQGGVVDDGARLLVERRRARPAGGRSGTGAARAPSAGRSRGRCRARARRRARPGGRSRDPDSQPCRVPLRPAAPGVKGGRCDYDRHMTTEISGLIDPIAELGASGSPSVSVVATRDVVWDARSYLLSRGLRCRADRRQRQPRPARRRTPARTASCSTPRC